MCGSFVFYVINFAAQYHAFDRVKLRYFYLRPDFYFVFCLLLFFCMIGFWWTLIDLFVFSRVVVLLERRILILAWYVTKNSYRSVFSVIALQRWILAYMLTCFLCESHISLISKLYDYLFLCVLQGVFFVLVYLPFSMILLCSSSFYTSYFFYYDMLIWIIFLYTPTFSIIRIHISFLSFFFYT